MHGQKSHKMIAQKPEIAAFHAHKATIAIADQIYVCNTLQAKIKMKQNKKKREVSQNKIND